MAIIPIISFILFNQIFLKRGHGRRLAFLYAIVLWCVVAVFYVELLSVFHHVTPFTAAIYWLCVCVAALIYRSAFFTKPLWIHPVKINCSSKTGWFCLGTSVFYLLVTAVIAWVAPPNTWDSMTYHMSRVMHWMQNQTVAFYPTAIPRQLYYTPFAEYMILHWQLLLGSDRLAGFMQWFSMLGSLACVSYFVRELGGSERAQWLVVLLTATIPMGIMQSTSTQTDYVAALWLSLFLCFSFRLWKKFSWQRVLPVAIVMALGVLTKGTFVVWLIVFFIAACVSQLKHGMRAWGIFMMATIVIVAIVNGPHMMRVAEYKNNREGKVDLTQLVNKSMNPAFFVSNVVRNVGMHLALPSQEWNTRVIRQGVVNIHHAMGIKDNESDITFGEYAFLPYFFFSEDEASNGFHLLLLLVTMALLLVFGKKIPLVLKIYMGLLIASFAVFCLIIQWQPWITRFHLPFFVCVCPWIVCVWDRVGAHKAMLALAILTSAIHLPWLLNNNMKPVVSDRAHIFNTPRFAYYFAKGIYLAPGVVSQSVNLFDQRGCYQVGLILGADTWEYPWWVGLRQKNDTVSRIEHVGVSNATQRYAYPKGPFFPCGIIKSPVGSRDQGELVLDGRRFVEKGRNEHVVLYMLP